jgi:AraC-like DNA-binding protein
MAKVAFHSVEHIGSPFNVVDEYLFPVPSEGHVVHNRLRKLLFLFEGQYRHETRDETGRRYSSVLATPGDILFVPHWCDQWYLPLEEEETVRVHALRLAFDSDELPPLPLGNRRTSVPGDPESDLTAFVGHHFQEFRHLPGGQRSGPVREALTQLRWEAEQRLPGHRFRVRALCISLLTLVARQFIEAGLTAHSLPSLERDDEDEGSLRVSQRAYRVHQAKMFIDQHRGEALRLGDIASHVQLSEEHLARVFKQATGQTLLEYARQTRLERAKTLLVNSDRTVSEIAALTGFSSIALFSRSFRKYVGQNPLAYRRRLGASTR